MTVEVRPLVAPEALRAALGPDAAGRLDAMLAEVAADPARLGRLFPAAARRTGRGPLPGATTLTEDAVRVALAAAAAPAFADADAFLEELRAVYRYGDADEKRAVLCVLNGAPELDGRDVLLDALRTNDTRLVGAAMGPHAARLADDEWRHGVLKCLFTGVPVAQVSDLDGRADAELAAMARRYAREREAAGRPVPDDLHTVLAAADPTKES